MAPFIARGSAQPLSLKQHSTIIPPSSNIFKWLSSQRKTLFLLSAFVNSYVTHEILFLMKLLNRTKWHIWDLLQNTWWGLVGKGTEWAHWNSLHYSTYFYIGLNFSIITFLNCKRLLDNTKQINFKNFSKLHRKTARSTSTTMGSWILILTQVPIISNCSFVKEKIVVVIYLTENIVGLCDKLL